MSIIQRNILLEKGYELKMDGLYASIFTKSCTLGCYHVLGYVFDKKFPSIDTFLTNKDDLKVLINNFRADSYNFQEEVEC